MLEPPKNIGQGLPLVEGILSKIREILAYLEQSRLIPGKGIRLMETPCGIMVSSDAVRTASPAVMSANKKEIIPFQYNGPFALRIGKYKSYSEICYNAGLIWTPSQCGYRGGLALPLPSASKLLVVDKDGELSAIDEGINSQFPVMSTDFWQNHALLGRYDAETESITQYHFSPIVFLIPTEDFIIAP